jgi:Uma2 family endonuclease
MPDTAEPRHWTYEDYVHLPDDGKRYEILRGEKLVCPSPKSKHQVLLLRLAMLFSEFIEERHLGRCFIAPLDVVLAEDVVLQPDILFIAKDRLGIVQERCIAGAPDFVVEILSESTRTRDYLAKRQLYAEHGVREYWIVDPDLDRVEPFVLEGGDLVHKGVISAGEVKSAAVLPGFAVKLADLFA